MTKKTDRQACSSKHTEKEINDAIAVVQQALRDDRIQTIRQDGTWRIAAFVGEVSSEYRAKPEQIKEWTKKYF